jgi:hypothetical protein
LAAFGYLVLAVGLPNAFHAKSLTVMSAAWSPRSARVTWWWLVRRRRWTRVGDIVTFRDPLNTTD